MKFMLAPDSFKGSLSAEQAVQAMVEGIRDVMPEAQMICMPIADGGEGTLEALERVLGGKRNIYKCQVHMAKKWKPIIYILGKWL